MRNRPCHVFALESFGQIPISSVASKDNTRQMPGFVFAISLRMQAPIVSILKHMTVHMASLQPHSSMHEKIRERHSDR